MISAAVINTIDYFNFSSPPIGQYSAESFPSRYLLLTGVAGYLLKSMAINELSNSLDYVSDNTTISDKSHGPAFLKAGGDFWNEYKELCYNIKCAINVGATYGNVGSEWAQRAYTV